MQHLPVPLTPELAGLVRSLRGVFDLADDAAVVTRALQVARLAGDLAADGHVGLVGADGVVRRLRLSANPYAELLSANRGLRDRHKGERGFILCNGESVAKQDLKPLAGEVVMSVSNGYLHRDFATIRPRYHALPQLTYMSSFTRDDAVAWFREMHAALAVDAELFLSVTEHALVREEGLFADRMVRWVDLRGPLTPPAGGELFPPTATLPGVQSVSIMALMLMMHMGFTSIYLIGVDHDQLQTGAYRYAFEQRSTKGWDSGIDEDGTVRDPVYDQLQNMIRLWQQYRVLKAVAQANGVRIYNASAGGALDEFERVNLADLTASPP